MIIKNNSFYSTPESIYSQLNSTTQIDDRSSTSTIITIIILSFLSISGWIFMSYALFGRSEAYRTKPDDQHGVSHYLNSSENPTSNDFLTNVD
ncbi:unnamed protein product [Adineta ricciae]|uniref:Uncharacterized protein n=1 Tax=Adineta ricciae TaxID=249248 RepID=A0A815SVA4_ADIRI|nr:unnamed protein product [Adineta ricciae]